MPEPGPASISIPTINQYRQAGIVVLVATLLFLPFSGKPFHIDSPVTVYIAGQILENPLNPPSGHFGPLLSPWNHTELPATSAFHSTPHPPLISLYTAFFIRVFGTGERMINGAFFPFLAGTLLFFLGLCRQMRIRSRLSATLLFAVSPVLLVNAQNVMYDVPLAMFCIGAFFLMFRSGSVTDAFLAGLCAGCACLVKFTAGTIVITGMFYFITTRNRRSLFIFLAVSGTLNALWLFHNLYFFHAWQLTQNGHAHYLMGDIRYRFERMFSYIGAGYVFPLFTLLIWWYSGTFRKTGIGIGILTLFWSVLLVFFVKYSAGAALFYWFCSFAGVLVTAHFFVTVCTGRGMPSALPTNSDGSSMADKPETGVSLNYRTLALHMFLQMLGGGFLTLYASRYTLSFIFILLLFSVSAIEAHCSERVQHLFWRSAIPVSLAISLLLSLSDYQVVNAEKRIAADLTRRYPSSDIFFKGRLGYLYYMDKAGAYSLTDTTVRPQPGAIAVENCFYRDDADFFTGNRNRLQLIDSCTYPVFPLRTIGGRAGFYGNDRLPYTITASQPARKFRMYRFVN